MREATGSFERKKTLNTHKAEWITRRCVSWYIYPSTRSSMAIVNVFSGEGSDGSLEGADESRLVVNAVTCTQEGGRANVKHAKKGKGKRRPGGRVKDT
ncbi:hypothetical protein PsorP6_011287 [Peronosclerospora sorghi]|uniref:Uncharacterized protein n=1 Tax=Peronosclerospora sorghi TaxID=230839 RepID=A0ACC0WJ92_9STRA|nr:hypothetical protein PsorP6_011287 [Peronosclerospora sorghi]